jgi:Family of unknown function (DUF6527)
VTLWVDASHGVLIDTRYVDGALHGIAYQHPCIAGGLREAFIPLNPPFKTGWDLVSVSPLTITPSLLCRACGHHGFLTEGKWVPAT